MGLIADAFKLLRPSGQTSIGATVPTWQVGVPQYQQPQVFPYIWAARNGYMWNEVVYAAVEELATSAAEPRLAAYRGRGTQAKKLDEHPILDLLERPNPFCDRFTLIASIIMHLSIAGNAYLHKARAASSQPVELWLLRPDRMRVIPDAQRYIGGYRYEWGDIREDVPAADVVQFKNRHPLDDWYGLAPLAVCANRVESDNAMRAFTSAFFRNAGVPAGLLTVSRAVGTAEREMIRNRFRGEVGGPGGWHSLMVLDGTDAKYEQMGFPLGERGLVMPELDEIAEARISQVFGVPLQLIGARLGLLHNTFASFREARATFWDETLIPLYQMLAAKLNSDLVPEFAGIDRVEFDLSTVGALQEDQDNKHKRLRDDLLAGGITREEFRRELGFSEKPSSTDTWLLGPRITEVAVNAPPPLPVAPKPDAAALPEPASTVVGGNGKH